MLGFTCTNPSRVVPPAVQKPDKNSYAFALNSLLMSPNEVVMVSSHPWDVFGAMQVGMQAVYVQRDATRCWPEFLDAPRCIVRNFDELADVFLEET